MYKRNPRSGQSLVEVLVAIAILVIGVFSVLRVFPPGFQMLSRTAKAGQVQSLSDALAQTVRNGQNQAADGIVERVPIADNQGNVTGWYVPVLPANKVSPGSVPPESVKQNMVDQNALFTQRSVIGERISLKSATGVSLMLLGPVFFPAAQPTPTQINAYMQVYDPNPYTEWPTSTNIPPRHYWIDYANGTLAVSPGDPDFNSVDVQSNQATERHYLLSYRTLSNSVPVDIVDEEVTMAAGQAATASGAAFKQGAPLPGSVQVFRDFPSGDGQNGTFQLLDPFVGIIQIQPYQVTYKDLNGYVQYAWVIPPDAKLAVDYMARDWQILRLEENVPGDSVIHLPISNLDILDRTYNATTRVLVVPLDNPTQQHAVNTVAIPGAAVPAASDSVNVRDGIVYVPTIAPGTPVRIYYGAFSTFAEQPVVSYSSYVPAPSSAAPGYRYYTQTTGSDATSNFLVLHFTVADAGKTVNLDYHYSLNGSSQVVLGKPLKLQFTINGLSFNGNNYDDAEAMLRYQGNGALTIDRVVGISYQARGVFLETGDVRRADDPLIGFPFMSNAVIWNPAQVGRLGEAMEDVYVAR